MTTRITKQQVQTKAEQFLDTIDGKFGRGVGEYVLDYAPIYGGYILVRICNEGGGETHPFGEGRRSAGEMWRTLNFACHAVWYKPQQGGICPDIHTSVVAERDRLLQAIAINKEATP